MSAGAAGSGRETLALSGSVEASTRVHAWIYGTNTVGAFVGAIAGGFALVPLLGLDGASGSSSSDRVASFQRSAFDGHDAPR